jgi:hypothetical protein
MRLGRANDGGTDDDDGTGRDDLLNSYCSFNFSLLDRGYTGDA